LKLLSIFSVEEHEKSPVKKNIFKKYARCTFHYIAG